MDIGCCWWYYWSCKYLWWCRVTRAIWSPMVSCSWSWQWSVWTISVGMELTIRAALTGGLANISSAMIWCKPECEESDLCFKIFQDCRVKLSEAIWLIHNHPWAACCQDKIFKWCNLSFSSLTNEQFMIKIYFVTDNFREWKIIHKTPSQAAPKCHLHCSNFQHCLEARSSLHIKWKG